MKGNPVAEVRDVFQNRTDLNQLCGPCEFRIDFFDGDGKPLKSTGEIKEAARLK